jgi:hypothetical protein
MKFRSYFQKPGLLRGSIKVLPLGVLSFVLAGMVYTGATHAQDNSISPRDDEPSEKSDKSSEQGTTRLRIQVVDANGKPVANASVYVRYSKPGGFLRKDKLAELDLKTNGEGGVKAPPVPRGQIMVQVIATGWHTYGKWYEIDKDEYSVDIKLEPPTRWY